METLFWVETVELGVRGEDEGKIFFFRHPPLQVTTEGTSREKKSLRKQWELSNSVKREQCGQCYKWMKTFQRVCVYVCGEGSIWKFKQLTMSCS